MQSPLPCSILDEPEPSLPIQAWRASILALVMCIVALFLAFLELNIEGRMGGLQLSPRGESRLDSSFETRRR